MAADVPEPSGGGMGALLQRKALGMPVWLLALFGLGAAWAIAKYRSDKASTTAASTTAASTTAADAEGQAVAPQFVIENNLPTESSPASTTPPGTPAPPVTSAPPTTTPPGTTAAPPVVTKAPPVTTPPKTPPKTTTPKTPAPAAIEVRVQPRDTLTSIAAKYGVKGGAAELYTYNTTPGVRDASAIATIKQRGPNLLEVGEEILIPPT